MNYNYFNIMINLKSEILAYDLPIPKTYLNKHDDKDLIYYSNIFIFESSDINLKDRLRYFSKLAKLSIKYSCNFSLAHNLTLSSKVNQELGDYKESIKKCLEANLLWQDLLSENELAVNGYIFSYTNLSNIYSSLELYDIAIKYLTAAQKLLPKCKDVYLPSIRINMNLGIVYQKIRRFKKSINSYDKILDLSELRKDFKVIIPTLINKSIVYTSKNNINESIDLNKKAEKYLINVEDVIYGPTIYQNLGDAFYLKKDYKTAKNYFIKSLKIFENKSFLNRIFTLKNNIANTDYKLGKYSTAIQLYKEVVKSDNGSYKDKIDASNMLGKIYEKQKKYKLALEFNKYHIEYINKYLEQKHNEFKVKSDKAIEGLEVQINFLNKEIENSALKIELIHKKRELVTKKITTLSENNFLNELISKLKDNSYENDGTIRKKLAETILACQSRIDHSADWRQFFKLFNDLNPGFKRSFDKYNLTEQELRVCMMIKLGLTALEIANILSISLRGIQQHRYRIKKKIDSKVNLTSFIRSIN